MGWKRKAPESTPSAPVAEPTTAKALDDVEATVEALRQQIDHPTVGLAALFGEVTQSRLKVLEAVQAGVLGLREENRELRRRQERMLSDLVEARAETREVSEVLRDLNRVGAIETTAPSAPVPDNSVEDEGELSESSQALANEPQSTTVADCAFEAFALPAAATEPAPVPETHGETVTEQPTANHVELKEAIEAAYRGTPAPAQRSRTDHSVPEEVDPAIEHGVLLLKAAGVASAELIAHRDTWEWVAALGAHHDHWRTPAVVEDIEEHEGREGRVRAVLSGRSLIALLIELWKTRADTPPGDADWALALTTYTRISARLADVSEHAEHRQTIRIILDDGLPTPTKDTP